MPVSLSFVSWFKLPPHLHSHCTSSRKSNPRKTFVLTVLTLKMPILYWEMYAFSFNKNARSKRNWAAYNVGYAERSTFGQASDPCSGNPTWKTPQGEDARCTIRQPSRNRTSLRPSRPRDVRRWRRWIWSHSKIIGPIGSSETLTRPRWTRMSDPGFHSSHGRWNLLIVAKSRCRARASGVARSRPCSRGIVRKTFERFACGQQWVTNLEADNWTESQASFDKVTWG